jgi:hypothetical protein
MAVPTAELNVGFLALSERTLNRGDGLQPLQRVLQIVSSRFSRISASGLTWFTEFAAALSATETLTAVLAVADEGLELVAQDGLCGFGVVFRDLGHAVVDEAVFLRGLVVNVPVQHGGPCFGSSGGALRHSCAMSLAIKGTAR